MTTRCQHIVKLRAMATNFASKAEGHEEEGEMSQAELWHEYADTIRQALEEAE